MLCSPFPLWRWKKEKKRKTRLHFKLFGSVLHFISLKLQLLYPLHQPAGMTHRRNWENNYKSWGFYWDKYGVPRRNGARIPLKCALRADRFAKQYRQNIKLDATCSLFFSRARREKQDGKNKHEERLRFSHLVLQFRLSVFHRCRSVTEWSA